MQDETCNLPSIVIFPPYHIYSLLSIPYNKQIFVSILVEEGGLGSEIPVEFHFYTKNPSSNEEELLGFRWAV